MMEARERIKEYRKSLGLTQKEFGELIAKECGLNYTTALVSYAEKGVVDFPKSVVSWCDSKIGYKAFINEFERSLDQYKATISKRKKKWRKPTFIDGLFEELKFYSKDQPFIAKDYAESLGVTETQVRTYIHKLRLNGIRICSDCKQRGYWLEENGGCYEQTRDQLLSRAYKIFDVVHAMDFGVNMTTSKGSGSDG